MPINTSNWSSFKIVDLFDIKRGSGLVTKTGKYPQITAKGNNNGIGGRTDEAIFCDSITISANGTNTGASFYQKGKFGAISDVLVLIDKTPLTESIKLFLSIVMSKTFLPKYNYGKKLGNTRLTEETIFLPTVNDKPDWEYMEKFIDTISKTITKPPKFVSNNEKLNTNTWSCFQLTDLFNISKGKDKDEPGKYPLITCATSNRGKHKTKYSSTFVTNVLTVSGDGAPGIAFWQDKPVGVFINVNILEPKFKCSNNIGLFLEVVITKSLSPKYAYGKKLGLSRILNESIFLPVKDNQPDWEFMENFMNNLIENKYLI